jgi:hypothetical protein
MVTLDPVPRYSLAIQSPGVRFGKFHYKKLYTFTITNLWRGLLQALDGGRF